MDERELGIELEKLAKELDEIPCSVCRFRERCRMLDTYSSESLCTAMSLVASVLKGEEM